MEGIVTLIIIIIVFNIISALARAVKGGRQGEEQKVLDGTGEQQPDKTVRLWEDGEDQFRYVSSTTGETYSFDRAGRDAGSADTAAAGVAEKEPAGPASEKQSRPVSTGVRPAASPQPGLQNILSNKESLVAAFIFHEIIDPPRSQRRKR